eukprot:2784914-Pyramimonas_sp.AAC.1
MCFYSYPESSDGFQTVFRLLSDIGPTPGSDTEIREKIVPPPVLTPSVAVVSHTPPFGQFREGGAIRRTGLRAPHVVRARACRCMLGNDAESVLT